MTTTLVVPTDEPGVIRALETALGYVQQVQDAESAYGLSLQCSMVDEAAKRVDKTGALVTAAKSLRLCAERRLGQLLVAEPADANGGVPDLDETYRRLQVDFGYSPTNARHLVVFAGATDTEWEAVLQVAQQERRLDRYVVSAILCGQEPKPRGRQSRQNLTPSQRLRDIARWIQWAAKEAAVCLDQLPAIPNGTLESTMTEQAMPEHLAALQRFAQEIEPHIQAHLERLSSKTFSDTSPIAMGDRRLLSLDEVRQRLGVGKSTIHELIRSGELRSCKIGARRYVSNYQTR